MRKNSQNQKQALIDDICADSIKNISFDVLNHKNFLLN